MADSPTPTTRRSCLSQLLILILMTVILALGAAMIRITQPQPLKDIDGYLPELKPAPVKNIRALLKDAVEREYPVTLTEATINQWLARTLVARQGGLLSRQVSFDRVCVRLEDGYAEVIMARQFFGRPMTVSMFLTLKRVQGPKGGVTEVNFHGGPYHKRLPLLLRGGRFGKLVVPQGFLLFVLPAYQQLAELFHPETHLGFEEMAVIKIEKHRLTLDPRKPKSSEGTPPPI
jgi:hypothetical protein